jgi:hypothetical protein
MADRKLSLLAAKNSTGAGTAFRIDVPAGKENVPLVIHGTFVGTVSVDGSLDGTVWQSLTSKTAAFIGVVPAFPYMRGNVTAYTSGAINVDIFGDRAFAN